MFVLQVTKAKKNHADNWIVHICNSYRGEDMPNIETKLYSFWVITKCKIIPKGHADKQVDQLHNFS